MAATTQPATELLGDEQVKYCEDVLALPTEASTGDSGWQVRADTVAFFEAAEDAGLLSLPYQGDGWEKAQAATPRDFVFIVVLFARAEGRDPSDAIQAEWVLSLDSIGVPFDEAFAAVCEVLPLGELASEVQAASTREVSFPLGRTGSASLESFTFSVTRTMSSSPNYAIVHAATGAYDAPGRLRCTMETREFIDGVEGMLSVVDTVLDTETDTAWLSGGDGWLEVQAGDPMATAALGFCVQAFTVASPVERDATGGESTTRNGVPVWHIDLVKEGLFEAPQPGDTLVQYEGWFAEDDLWPVAIIYELETDGRMLAEHYGLRLTDAQDRGTIHLTSEIDDINSPEVTVVVPPH